MAQTQRSSIEIEASPEEIFEIITDIESYPEWAQGIQHAEVLEEDADGLPTRAEMVADAVMRTVRYVLAYEYEYPTRVSWVSEPGGDLKLVEGEYRLTPRNGTTEVEYELTLDPGFPVPGFVLGRAQKAIMSVALRGLKEQAQA